MRIIWDEVAKRFYETGIRMGVLFPIQADGLYSKGTPWNGLTGVTENPSGGGPTALWADDIKYLTLISAEEYGGTITAYTYPDEFAECDGSAEIAPGISIGQQNRKVFGLCYRTVVGNGVAGSEYGYKLHLVYGAQASPFDQEHGTINDNPDATEFSWEFTTTPVNVPGYKPTASLVIDSTKVDAEKLKAIEDILYGTDDTEARLPLPE